MLQGFKDPFRIDPKANYWVALFGGGLLLKRCSLFVFHCIVPVYYSFMVAAGSSGGR